MFHVQYVWLLPCIFYLVLIYFSNFWETTIYLFVLYCFIASAYLTSQLELCEHWAAPGGCMVGGVQPMNK